jgi:TRAP-type C4-dicarboxylate transport system substrate-binding protein
MNAGSILAEKGMTVTTLTPAEVTAFREIAQPAVRTYLEEQHGAELVADLVSAIEEANQ